MSNDMVSRDRLRADYSAIVILSLRRASLGIAPVFVNNNGPDWQSVGTCFLVIYQDNLYLITAEHVITKAFKNKQVVAVLFGKQVFLHGLYFIEDSSADLAITMLPPGFLESYGITEIFAPRIEPLPPIYEATGEYHLMGYPASKNKFDLRYNKSFTGKIVTIGAKLDERNLNLSKISTPINIHYDHKAYGSAPPGLHGMSGGLLVEVMSRKIGDKSGLSLAPRGVLCEWHEDHRIVVAVDIDSVIKLIEDRSIIWTLAGNSHGQSIPAVWEPPQPLESYLPIELSPPKSKGK